MYLEFTSMSIYSHTVMSRSEPYADVAGLDCLLLPPAVNQF